MDWGTSEDRPREFGERRVEEWVQRWVMPTAIDEDVLTYQEAAVLLKVSARTLERWTREGLVPYIRLGNNTLDSQAYQITES